VLVTQMLGSQQLSDTDLVWAGQLYRQVTMLSPHQLHVIHLLGCKHPTYTLPHRNLGGFRGTPECRIADSQPSRFALCTRMRWASTCA
jgi:hypothetical protein